MNAVEDKYKEIIKDIENLPLDQGVDIRTLKENVEGLFRMLLSYEASADFLANFIDELYEKLDGESLTEKLYKATAEKLKEYEWSTTS